MRIASDSGSRTTVSELADSPGSPYLERSEQAFLECLRAGDDSCYETLVRRFGPQVLATAKRYLRTDADAADCFQETFIAVFENIAKFEQRSTIGTWVRSIAVNQCLMRLRSRARRQEDSIENLLPVFDEDGARIDHFSSRQPSTIGDSLDAAHIKSIVREKIDELPENARVMLLLRDIDGYSTKETAAKLGIELSAAKTRLHRARSALRSLLSPMMEQLKHDADV